MRILILRIILVCALGGLDAAELMTGHHCKWETSSDPLALRVVPKGHRGADETVLAPSKDFMQACMQMVVGRCEDTVMEKGYDPEDVGLVAMMPEDFLALAICTHFNRLAAFRCDDGRVVIPGLKGATHRCFVILTQVADTMLDVAQMVRCVTRTHSDSLILLGGVVLKTGGVRSERVDYNGVKYMVELDLKGSPLNRLRQGLGVFCLSDFALTSGAAQREIDCAFGRYAMVRRPSDFLSPDKEYCRYIDKKMACVDGDLLYTCSVDAWDLEDIVWYSFAKSCSVVLYHNPMHPHVGEVYDQVLLDHCSHIKRFIAPMLLLLSDTAQTFYDDGAAFSRASLNERLEVYGRQPNSVVIDTPFWLIREGSVCAQDVVEQCALLQSLKPQDRCNIGVIMPTYSKILKQRGRWMPRWCDVNDILERAAQSLVDYVRTLGHDVYVIRWIAKEGCAHTFLQTERGEWRLDKKQPLKYPLDGRGDVLTIGRLKTYAHDDKLVTEPWAKDDY